MKLRRAEGFGAFSSRCEPEARTLAFAPAPSAAEYVGSDTFYAIDRLYRRCCEVADSGGCAAEAQALIGLLRWCDDRGEDGMDAARDALASVRGEAGALLRHLSDKLDVLDGQALAFAAGRTFEDLAVRRRDVRPPLSPGAFGPSAPKQWSLPT